MEKSLDYSYTILYPTFTIAIAHANINKDALAFMDTFTAGAPSGMAFVFLASFFAMSPGMLAYMP